MPHHADAIPKKLRRAPAQAALVGAILAAALLAGCTDTPAADPSGASGGSGSDGASDPMMKAFEDALAEEGTVFHPASGDSMVRLKLLEPSATEGLKEGIQPIVVLLYDLTASLPVTDADFTIEARMPAMGHGTAPEEHPVHDANGIYRGSTTFSMPGRWVINLDPQLADGTVLAFDVAVTVGSGDGMDGMDGHDGMDGMDGHGNDSMGDGMGGDGMHDAHDEPTYASFQEAMDAMGTTFISMNGSSHLHAKVLKPHPLQNLSVGANTFTVLLHTPEPHAAVMDATVTLQSMMPAHDGMDGHGGGNETDPPHHAHGVYTGTVHPNMKGDWVLHLKATLADGTRHAWEIAYTVGDGGGHGGSHGNSHGDGDGSDSGSGSGHEGHGGGG